jgi:hypothetical protein
MARVRKIRFPAESQLHPSLDQAFYSDAFEADLIDMSLTPAEIATRAFASTPMWVEGLVQLRDRLVALFGLKMVGRLRPAGTHLSSGPAVGDAFSIFRVISVDSTELVLGIDDTHLDVRMSFLKRLGDGQASYVISSWVKTHNMLGRIYMLPVAPVHRLLVRLMMRGVPM